MPFVRLGGAPSVAGSCDDSLRAVSIVAFGSGWSIVTLSAAQGVQVGRAMFWRCAET
ncbi:MAG: hypothetical protein KF773_36570 [Deltaproteobacteria bacterium]|nr:hypothetical protein [Deltaproteobacteria bacterium]